MKVVRLVLPLFAIVVASRMPASTIHVPKTRCSITQYFRQTARWVHFDWQSLQSLSRANHPIPSSIPVRRA
jgi:hypothetical protein